VTHPSTVEIAAVPTSDRRATGPNEDSLPLNDCEPFQTIVVNTLTSVYEVIVLDGNAGDVIIQGGSGFPEFSRACFIGSVAPDGEFKPICIEVGLRMRFCAKDRITLTSPVRAYHLPIRATTPPL
jgi:hypothetical protein